MPGMATLGRVTRDLEVQQDLERCIRISDGASRILSIAQNQLQCVKAAKTLFVTNEQLYACLRRIQQEKVQEATQQQQPNADSVEPSTKPEWNTFASLHVSDIRIPLLWRTAAMGANTQRLINRITSSVNPYILSSTPSGAGDSSTSDVVELQSDAYCVFCIVRVGDVIRDTQLVFDVIPGTSDVRFTDELVFDNITPDFRCTIEVYAFPKPSAKTSSLFARRRGLGMDALRRASEMPDPDSLNTTLASSSGYFDLIGRCVLKLPQVNHEARAHTLEMAHQLTANHDSKTDTPLYTIDPIPTPSICDLPLFGNLSLRLVARPNSIVKPLITGLLWIRKLNPSPSQVPAQLYYCELRECLLSVYEVFEEAANELLNGSDGLQQKMSPSSPGPRSPNPRTSKHLIGPRRLVPIPSGWITYDQTQPSFSILVNSMTMFLDTRPVNRLVTIEAPPRKTLLTKKPSTVSEEILLQEPNAPDLLLLPQTAKPLIVPKKTSSSVKTHFINKHSWRRRILRTHRHRPRSAMCVHRSLVKPRYPSPYRRQLLPRSLSSSDIFQAVTPEDTDSLSASVSSAKLSMSLNKLNADTPVSKLSSEATDSPKQIPSPQVTSSSGSPGHMVQEAQLPNGEQLHCSSPDVSSASSAKVPQPTVDVSDHLPRKSATVNFWTLRIGSSIPGSSPTPTDRRASEVANAFELAVTTENFVEQWLLDASHSCESDEDLSLAGKWLSSFQQHINEQEIWGENSFSVTSAAATPMDSSARQRRPSKPAAGLLGTGPSCSSIAEQSDSE